MLTRLLLLSVASAAPLAAQAAVAPSAAHATVPLSPADSTRLFARGKQINDWFLAGMLDSVYAAASAETRQKMGSVDWLHSHWERFIERAGAPIGEVTMALTRRDGEPQFWYEARFSEITNDLVVVRWILDTDGRITGVGMGPKGTARKDPPAS